MDLMTMELLGWPYKDREYPGSQTGQVIWWVKTNQGPMKLTEIATALDLTVQGLIRRIGRVGFDHPEVLHKGGKGGWTDESRKRQRERKLKGNRMVWPGAESIPDSDIGKYESLSDDCRSYNLSKVRNPGVLEQGRFGFNG